MIFPIVLLILSLLVCSLILWQKARRIYLLIPLGILIFPLLLYTFKVGIGVGGSDFGMDLGDGYKLWRMNADERFVARKNFGPADPVIPPKIEKIGWNSQGVIVASTSFVHDLAGWSDEHHGSRQGYWAILRSGTDDKVIGPMSSSDALRTSLSGLGKEMPALYNVSDAVWFAVLSGKHFE